MAATGKRTSEEAEATSLTGDELVRVSQGGVSKRTTVRLMSELATSEVRVPGPFGDYVISQNEAGDLVIRLPDEAGTIYTWIKR